MGTMVLVREQQSSLNTYEALLNALPGSTGLRIRFNALHGQIKH